MNAPPRQPTVSLDSLASNQSAIIDHVAWEALGPDGRRLRELGVDEGVEVEPLHRGFIGRDPIACRIGRMTVAIRRAHARHVQVRVTS